MAHSHDVVGSRFLRRAVRTFSGHLAGAVTFAAIALTAALGGFIHGLQAEGRSAAAIAMTADMDMRDMERFWSFPWLQASGLVGLLLAYVTAAVGLWTARCAACARPHHPSLDGLHRYLSLTVVAAVLIHMVMTALDAMGDSWKTVLVPGTWASQGWPQAVTGYNTGIIAAYTVVLVGPSYYLRRLIRPGAWRILHRAVAVFYVLSLWHAMILGLDLAYYAWLRPAIWLLQIPLLGLLMSRIRLTAFSRDGKTPRQTALSRCAAQALLTACALGIVTLAVIVVTGHAGFIATV